MSKNVTLKLLVSKTHIPQVKNEMSLFSKKQKIQPQKKKKDSFSGWLKCLDCKEMIHNSELVKNSHCCPKCDHHYQISAKERIASLADPNSFKELFQDLLPADPLNFVDSESYTNRLKRAKKNSKETEAAIVGTCKIEGIDIALGVLDFHFMGGSMGSVVGEKITRIIEEALTQKLPLIIVSTSGGARMQESTLSLMQMAKTAASLSKLHEEKIPYISVLTHPTSGGVTASFASLGDLIIAEPKALICFAGPRVIEQTIGHKLPKDAQKSEFLLKHGMIDCIVHRHLLKVKLAEFLSYLNPRPKGRKDGHSL